MLFQKFCIALNVKVVTFCFRPQKRMDGFRQQICILPFTVQISAYQTFRTLQTVHFRDKFFL